MIDLFKAADKYDVLGLVQECVASFRELTGADEVAPLLQVCAADQSLTTTIYIRQHLYMFACVVCAIVCLGTIFSDGCVI